MRAPAGLSAAASAPGLRAACSVNPSRLTSRAGAVATGARRAGGAATHGCGWSLAAWLWLRACASGDAELPLQGQSKPASTEATPPVAAASAKPPNEGADSTALSVRGEALAATICQSCHLFPEPSLLDKTTWQNHTLPFMGRWLGMAKMNLDLRPGGRRVAEAGIFPDVPALSPPDWEAICQYFVSAAPERPLPQPPRPKIQKPLPGFSVIGPDYRFKVPLTTLVKIDAVNHRFFLGDAGTRTLNVLDRLGNLRFSTPLDSPPVAVRLRDTELDLCLVGSVTPSDEPEGKVVTLTLEGERFGRPREVVAQLPRPVDLAFGDLNGDGKEDLVVGGFGNYLGRLSWFEQRGEGGFREHVLAERPGAVRAFVRDLNRDGRPDIVALMAQAREGVYLFRNLGGGEFQEEALVLFHPAFGSASLELVDVNRDGALDLLLANGDSGEYVSPTKRYHGVRLYLNDGQGAFAPAWFFPLNGAYKAMAADFDGDGDLDIAAISFFPDYERTPEESFVYLENQGGLQFAAYSMPECQVGRWLTMDVGDLDGDGWPDLVLGSFIRGPDRVPREFQDFWERTGPSFLILHNTRGGK
jgi:hypothetical protein